MAKADLIHHVFQAAVGASIEDCVALAYRMSQPDAPRDELESWIARYDGGRLSLLNQNARGWAMRLWQSPSRKVYVGGYWAEGRGIAVHEPSVGWRQIDLGEGYYEGVYGLSDDYVFAWGGAHENATFMSIWEGRAWRQIPSPGQVINLHGVAPDLVFAVGADGLIARWDGSTWTRMVCPGAGFLNSVHVVSADEVYATGPSRRVLAGSIYGWSERAVLPFNGYGVVKWNDEVWIAGGLAGLHRLRDDRIELIDEGVWAEKMLLGDGCVLMTARSHLHDTKDGKSFRTIGLDELAGVLAPIPPTW